MTIDEKIKEVNEKFNQEISVINSLEDLENIKNKYLSRKGLVAALFSELSKLDSSERPKFGNILNDLKSTNNLSINVWKPIRIALTGNEHGPDIGKVAEILGNDQCSLRIHKFLEKNVH